MHRSLIAVSLLALLISLFAGMKSAAASAPAAQAVVSATARSGDEPVPKFHGCSVEAVQAVNEGYEQRVVELVNQERAGHGLPPLKRTQAYELAARYHATDLGHDDYFDHPTYDRVDGDLVLQCDTWQRISNFVAGANAENAAAGSGTPEDVMRLWMDSGGHRDNILNTYSWEIGVGYFEGSGQYNTYWVQDFGRRNDIYPLIINGEAISTGSPTVSLYIYGDWEEMRLRNEDGAWTGWKPFQASSTWTLSGRGGENIVTVELRSGDRMASSSDTILMRAERTALMPLFLPMTKK